MMVDLGLLILRLVVGLLLAGHGAQKLFGMFSGHGLKGTSGWLGSLGLRPAGLWALLAGLSEFGGGMLVALGLLTPLGAVGIATSMLMAILVAHRGKLWVTEGGMEYNLVLIAAAAALVFTGPGQFSFDAVLGLNVPLPLTLPVVALALLMVFVALGTRSRFRRRPRATSYVSRGGRVRAHPPALLVRKESYHVGSTRLLAPYTSTPL